MFLHLSISVFECISARQCVSVGCIWRISLFQCVSTLECASVPECVFVSLSECLREPANVCLPECRCPGVCSVCRSTRSVLSDDGLLSVVPFPFTSYFTNTTTTEKQQKNPQQSVSSPTPPQQAFTFEFEISQTPSRFQVSPHLPCHEQQINFFLIRSVV